MRKRIHQQIFWYGCLAIAFMLPVWGKLVPTLIVIMILNWLVSGEYIRTVPLLFKEKPRRNTLLFAGLYILYAAGLLYTTDFGYAWFDMEVKLSLLIFPIIFATADVGFLNSKHLRLLMQVYIAGCVIGSLLLLGHAWTLWREGVPGAFYYTRLSWYFHASYFAMYLDFAMAFIAIELISRYSSRSSSHKVSGLNLAYFLILAWFFVFIFLLSSKMGLICMVLLAVMASAEIVVRYKKTFLGLGILILFLMCTRAGLHVFSVASSRISESEATLSGKAAPGNAKSTSDRIDIWKVSLGVIKDNFLIGVGTGDVKDVLVQEYRDKQVEQALELKLNAHNQYLQTFMTLGLAGIAVLLLMLFLPMTAAFRQRYYIYFIFLLFFALNIAVESMFETQAGVVWYAFFNSFLFSVSRDV